MGLTAPPRLLAGWSFAITLVGLVSVGQPTDAQDSAEAVAVGRCLWQLGSCDGWDWTYRPPLPPMLAALWPGPGSAGVVLSSLIAAASCVFPARRVLRGEGAGWALPLAIVAIPGIRTAAASGDPRILGVLCLLWSAAMVVEGRAWAAGAFVGLAALCRVEHLAVVPVVALLMAVRPGVSGRGQALSAVVSAGTAALVLAPWALAISFAIGRPTLVSRSWEGEVAEWSQTLTVPLVHLWVGPSAWEGPLRATLRSLPQSTSAIDLSGLADTVRAALAVAVPAWLVLAAVAWIALSALPVNNRVNRVFAVVVGVGVLLPPALLALATRPGREASEASLIPALVLGAVAVDAAFGTDFSRAVRRRRGPELVRIVSAAVWVGWLAAGVSWGQGVPPRERTGASVALSEVLRSESSDQPVGAVFATSRILREAGRQWVPLDGRVVPREIVIAQGDDVWAVLGLLIPPTAQVTVKQTFGGDGWATLLSVEEEPPRTGDFGRYGPSDDLPE